MCWSPSTTSTPYRAQPDLALFGSPTAAYEPPTGGIESLLVRGFPSSLCLLDRWREELPSGAGGSRRQAEQDLAWFQTQFERNACWTCSPEATHGPSRAAGITTGMGEDWIWWPRGFPAGRRVAIVSSRARTSRWKASEPHTMVTDRVPLVPSPNGRSNWFTALRQTCEQIRIANEVAMVGEGTTTEAYVRRYSQHIGLRTICLSAPPSGAASYSLVGWMRHVRQVTARVESLSEYHGYLLPKKLSAAACDQATPWADTIVVAASDQVRVLSLRPKGNLMRLLQERLICPTHPIGSVWLALGPSLVPYDLAEPLLRRGAVGWHLIGGAPADSVDVSPVAWDKAPLCCGASSASRHDITYLGPRLVAGDVHRDEAAYLIHCTRSSRGPWPDETQAQYFDRQLQPHMSMDATATALATLMRILRQRRILATSRTIRGGLSVVSFTAAKASELAQLHTFRPHRNRWDFEPYAIAIRRSWLAARGARPVIYAEDAHWKSLPPDCRPYFQLATTRGKKGRQQVDWTVEKEWRHWGDLALDELAPADAWVIVPTPAEARVLAPLSPWPVRTLT